MITVKEAEGLILEHLWESPVEKVNLFSATHRVLRQELVADRDFPPFDRVMMDGIAIVYDTFQKGRREFRVDGIQAAGDPPLRLDDAEACLEVMTGAMLPQGTDTVLPYEHVKIEDGIATIMEAPPHQGKNIHPQGTDRTSGEVLVAPGAKLGGAELAVAATVGQELVEVSQLPKIAVISSGDELVDVGTTPEAYQIRRSNSFAIAGGLAEFGIEPEAHHLPDDKEGIYTQLKAILETCDTVIISGGVSKGKFDYIPETLDRLGVKKLFHRVKQRPGKPFWFGITETGKTVFAFPGNPVSTFLCYYRYFRPWLMRSLKMNVASPQKVQLAEGMTFKPDLTYFLQVSMEEANGKITARPRKGKGSGDFTNLLEVDGFVELPQGKDEFEAGETFDFFPFRF